MDKMRVVDAGFDCPKCGKPVVSREVGITIAEQAEPIRWVVDKRWCSGGCHLVASDIPKEHGGLAD
jgi:hypothetical protein